MLKIYKQITKIAFIAAILIIPAITHADDSYGYDNYGGDIGGWSDYGGSSYGDYYTPDYSYDYGYDTPSYDYGSNYDSGSYGSSYGTPSYGGSSYSPSYGGGYYGGSYGGSSIPTSATAGASNQNNNTSNSSSNSNPVNTNNNVNNNNVYVYTNPTGNAVVYNPAHQNLDGYCNIVPTNPRLGQVVTATAYATGGVGSYSYTWGGDINQTSGVSTSFTSYTAGTKSITVTIRSDQEVITKTCNVTFVNNNTTYYNTTSYNTPTYSGSSVNITGGVTSGTPVSGIYLNDLPATGLSLSFVDYMIAFMVIVLAAVATFVYQAKKRLTVENI